MFASTVIIHNFSGVLSPFPEEVDSNNNKRCACASYTWFYYRQFTSRIEKKGEKYRPYWPRLAMTKHANAAETNGLEHLLGVTLNF